LKLATKVNVDDQPAAVETRFQLPLE